MNEGRSFASRRKKVRNNEGRDRTDAEATAAKTTSGICKRRLLWKRWAVFLRKRRTVILLCGVMVILYMSRKGSSMKETRQDSSIREGPLLRRDWTSFTRLSPLAQRYKDLQNNCSLAQHSIMFSGIGFGLGSELHSWTTSICTSLAKNVRLKSTVRKEPWLWLDQEACAQTPQKSPLSCYFPSVESQCNNTVRLSSRPPEERDCDSIQQEFNIEKADMRMAGIQFLFSHVSPIVIAEAERQLRLVFGGKPVPKNLITVHIRWGDKVTSREMKFVPIKDYLQAISTFGKRYEKVSVYLATEDPKAVEQFQQMAPSEWDIYVDQFFHEVKDYRQVGKELWNQAAVTSSKTKGRAGLLTLASLLVAMEANDFVLTTASNWSRLMNELRSMILNEECNNCTRMIDLQEPAPTLQQ